MNSNIGIGLNSAAALEKGAAFPASIGYKNVYNVECLDSQGKVKWTERVENLMTSEGLDEALDKFWKGSAYTADFFVGITSGAPVFAAANTLSSHAGWTEVSAYTETERPDLTLGTVASQSLSNSANKAVYTVNADSTVIGGVFIATDDTKGGTAGILIAGGAFSGGNKSADNGDTLNVTITLTGASA